MKTIEDWFKMLPNHISKKAIKNTSENILNEKCKSMSEALWCAFIWKNSREGHDYWGEINKKYG